MVSVAWRVLALWQNAGRDAEDCAYMTGCPERLAGRLRHQLHRSWLRLRA